MPIAAAPAGITVTELWHTGHLTTIPLGGMSSSLCLSFSPHFPQEEITIKGSVFPSLD
jgi:hypothetical protein